MTSQFAFPATLSEAPGLSTVTAYNAEAENPLFVANSHHPNWTAILFGLRAGDPAVWDLFDVASGVMNRFMQISDRYAWNGSEVTFDGDPVSGPFVDLLTRTLEDGNEANYTALAKFGEKVAMNPSEHSREQMFRFLSNHEFQITAEGDVVAYKSFNERDGVLYSGFRSQAVGKPSAFVNGVAIEPLSNVPQKVGDVVSMPRSEVDPDPNNSCSRGLHVATQNYWGQGAWNKNTYEVHIHPRDFVAVPNGEGAKSRTCRYFISRKAVEPDDRAVLSDAPTYDWEGDVGYRVERTHHYTSQV